MDSCREIIDHMNVWSIRLNKTGILLICSCVNTTKWMHHIEKKLIGNCKRMLQVILAATPQQYGYLPPISKTIQVRHTRHMEHCWRNMGTLISDNLLWTPTYRRACVGRPEIIYFIRFVRTHKVVWKTCRERWMIGTEKIREIHAVSATWWW